MARYWYEYEALRFKDMGPNFRLNNDKDYKKINGPKCHLCNLTTMWNASRHLFKSLVDRPGLMNIDGRILNVPNIGRWKCKECKHTWTVHYLINVEGTYYIALGPTITELHLYDCELKMPFYIIGYEYIDFIKVPQIGNALLVHKNILIYFDSTINNDRKLYKLNDEVICIVRDDDYNYYSITEFGRAVSHYIVNDSVGSLKSLSLPSSPKFKILNRFELNQLTNIVIYYSVCSSSYNAVYISISGRLTKPAIREMADPDD